MYVYVYVYVLLLLLLLLLAFVGFCFSGVTSHILARKHRETEQKKPSLLIIKRESISFVRETKRSFRRLEQV